MTALQVANDTVTVALPLSSYVDGKPMKDQALNVVADALAKLWKRSAR